MSTGHLGDSPGDVRVGNGVRVIEGSNYPFVLRRRGKHYLVVGKAGIYRMSGWDVGEPRKLDGDPMAHVIVLV